MSDRVTYEPLEDGDTSFKRHPVRLLKHDVKVPGKRNKHDGRAHRRPVSVQDDQQDQR